LHHGARDPASFDLWREAILGCRDVVDLDSLDRTSMACPALPTCGLAVTESERSLPDINRRIRTLMTKLGFDEGESFVIRMTGELCRLPTSGSMISEHHVPQEGCALLWVSEGTSADGTYVFRDSVVAVELHSHVQEAGRYTSCNAAMQGLFHGPVQMCLDYTSMSLLWQRRLISHREGLTAEHVPCEQGAPTAARGRTWRSWALWAMAPTATSFGWAAAPTRRDWRRSSKTASRSRCRSTFHTATISLAAMSPPSELCPCNQPVGRRQ
jgi:hypothetical protein